MTTARRGSRVYPRGFISDMESFPVLGGTNLVDLDRKIRDNMIQNLRAS